MKRSHKDIKMIISKSQYLKGMQCPKALWLYRHRPDLKPEISESQQFLFDTGHEIGRIAQKYFANGIEIKTDHFRFDMAAKATQKAIEQGHNVILEGSACSDDGAYCRIDILNRVEGTDSWDLIEVKGSTGVKDYHIDDITFQRLAFLGSGYNIRKSILMHINNQYLRQGDLNINALFNLEDHTDTVKEGLSDASGYFKKLKEMIQDSNEPVIDIGGHCNNPFSCDYVEYCWKDIPEYSVYNVVSGSKLNELLDNDIVEVSDIPDDFNLTHKQLIDVKSHKTNELHVDEESIEAFLSNIEYPVYFLDYETIMPAIPIYDNTRPYQQIPFQYSLHIQESKNGESSHTGFLHTKMGDPRPHLINFLIKDIGPKGSVVVYNKAFESRINNELARDFPEYQEKLDNISNRFVDLLVPFRSRYICHPDMKSSASMKSVLPAFFPEMSYDNLDISDGETASLRYLTYAKGDLPEGEEINLFQNLREYCEQDTFAEVRLLSVLRKILRTDIY